MDAAVQTINDFDNLLGKVIHDVLAYCLGEGNAEIIEKSMEKNGLPLKEIPLHPEEFSEQLRNMVGFGSRQIIGPAVILEETRLEVLYRKLKTPTAVEKPCNTLSCT